MSAGERSEGLASIALAALDAVRKAGADEADVLLVEGDDREVRVRDREIDYVKQAQGRGLGIRALVGGAGGLRTAIVSTSDLAGEAVRRMAEEAVALARETAPDPLAGLPEAGFASDRPELALLDPADREVPIAARIEEARRAEAAARATDPRITNSEGSQAASGFARVIYANSRGFVGDYASASHGLFAEPIAEQAGRMQRDHWSTSARRLADLEDAAVVGRTAARRAVRRLGARPVPTCEVPVLFDARTAPSLIGQLASCASGYSIYRQSSFLDGRMGERIASGLVTIVDDGRLPGGLGSKPFDGEGLATRRTAIVRAGRLES